MKYKIMSKTSVILEKCNVSTTKVHTFNGFVENVDGEWGGWKYREYMHIPSMFLEIEQGEGLGQIGVLSPAKAWREPLYSISIWYICSP